MTAAILTVAGLSIETAQSGGRRRLVDDLSFAVAEGEVLGVVGESGSGKSLTALAIAGLLPPGVEARAGSIRLSDIELAALDRAGRRRLAGDRIGFVFQDPLSSFNPVRRIGAALTESARRHQRLGARQARALAIEALADMRLPDPHLLIDAYPHQLSGGQRQRVMIALALINDPALLIADEPTTALDATVQRSVLALLKRRSAGRATIMITHDLGVAVSLCDRILVLHEGREVESGEARALLAAPTRPYTRALIDARLRLSATGLAGSAA